MRALQRYVPVTWSHAEKYLTGWESPYTHDES